MKNFKKILSIFVILSMVASFFVTANASSTDATYTVDTICFTDANGNTITTLDGASTVKVSTSVTASEDSDVMFVAALYNGDKLVKSGKAFVTATAGESEDLEATIALEEALPTPAEGYKVKAFLWEKADKTPITKTSIFPGSNVDLAKVTVDGEEIEVSDAMTYEVAIDQMVAPNVTAVAADASTKVSIAKPERFPGKSTITLTANDGTTKDYVINYTTTKGVTVTAPAANLAGTGFHAADDPDALEVSDSAATPTSFKFGSHVLNDRAQYLKEGSTAGADSGKFVYFNDIRSINDAYDYLHGADYIKSEVANRALSFTLARDAVVRVFGADGTAITSADASSWKVQARVMSYMKASISRGQGMPEGYNSLSPKLDEASFNTMYYKTVSAGEEVNLTFNGFNRVIVIDYLGYLEDPEVALGSLNIDGTAVKSADLRNSVFTYSVSKDLKAVPPVEATAYDANAEVEVINPGIGTNGNIFPGKTIVRVTNGSKTKDYIVKYTTDEALLTTTDIKYGKNFHAADDYNAVEVSGAIVGSQLFQDRKCPIVSGSSYAYMNDIRSISDEWDYLNGTDYFMNIVDTNPKTVSFTLNRDAVVRVFSTSSGAVSGWTRETKGDGYLVASLTSGQLTAATSSKFTNMFYKSFKKGDTVDITFATREAITVIDYVGYTKTAVSLETLEVGGVAKEIGSESVFTHAVAPDTEVAPKVAVTTSDPNATVEIIYPGQKNNPNIFPGKTIIRVTKGEMTKDYTVKYTCDGRITTTAGYYGTDFHAADDANATMSSDTATGRVFPRGSTLYGNRTDVNLLNKGYFNYFNDIRTISDEYDYLNGSDFFSSAVGGTTAKFTVNRDAIIRVFTNNGNLLSTANGWTKETNQAGYMTASTTSGQGLEEGYNPNDGVVVRPNANFTEMFYKSAPAGTALDIAITSNEAIIVVEYANYIETYVALSSLTVGGEEKTVGRETSWTHPVAADAATCPAVVATAMDPNATVDVIYPFEEGNANVFPGRTIIRVTNGSDVAEYEVKYTCDGFVGMTNTSSTGGRTDESYFGTNFHEPGDFGLTYGSQLYYDRIGTPQGNISYYNDVREFSDEIKDLKGADYIMANRNQGANVTHHFTLTRPATVRILCNSSPAVSDGWTKVGNANGFAKVSYTLGSGVTGHANYCPLQYLTNMIYKSFDKGAEVSVTPPDVTSVVVIGYEGYTAAE